ncbi:uncharacterized protein LAJ45_00088 [Morchella importuna]|uniref:uncharacterized protein n=1 Tax=Morchella importuna TaxID=1174673 RepID=UPI001E8E6CB5|nr:uncharacterized protein LAJ45_00088 [Morchella importuna]KAH8155079.1 hypothetical protein LAJ45_00088 [Morchella importuna]
MIYQVRANLTKGYLTPTHLKYIVSIGASISIHLSKLIYSQHLSVNTYFSMLSEATRPPWLYQKHKLEKFVENQNWKLNIVDLRCDRNRCELVDNILEKIALTEQLKPSEFEKGLARNHLAVDLQNILQRWCGIGLKKTIEGSALLGGPPTPLTNRWAPPLSVGGVGPVPKVEVTSPETTVFSPPSTTFNCIGSGDAYQLRAQNIFPSSQHPILSSRPSKRQLDGVDQYDDITKMAKIDRTSSFTCPYYARNKHAPDHADCANKTFPNPRKLKEHVWRWLKPFKCINCGEGFGREKTRAIHCEQRKTKCKTAVSTYEQSAEFRRDQQIETAKSTQEMIRIFDEYEKEVNDVNAQNINNQERSSSSESEGSCSSPDNTSDSEMDGSGGCLKYTAPLRVELEQRPVMAVRQRSESLHQAHILREDSDSTLEGRRSKPV